METKKEGYKEPLQYDKARDILNTPPPSLTINTNLLIITVMAVFILAVSFVKLPVDYVVDVKVVSHDLSGALVPIKQTTEEGGRIKKIAVNDRTKVVKGELIFSIESGNGRVSEVVAPNDGILIFSKPLQKGDSVQHGETIAWIKGENLKNGKVVLSVQLDEIDYFEVNNERLLTDANGGACLIRVNEIQFDNKQYLITASIKRSSGHFDFTTARLKVELEEQTLLEQFTN